MCIRDRYMGYKIGMSLSFMDSVWSFFTTPSCARTFILIFGIDWLIGIIFIQYFYYRTGKLRNLSEEAKKKYAPYINQLELWNRFGHTFFSFLMLPRFVIFISMLIVAWAFLKVLSIGSKHPLLGWRRTVMIAVVKHAARIILFCISFVYIKYDDFKIDYSQWLGKDWKAPEEAIPILIANHRGVMVLLRDESRTYFYSCPSRSFPAL
eukprot:TRINITY_DN16741_c0_g1_i1.p1 TRINITY_DN16741_c0_g1~~TRINITY_DN16741_c0_g1_i1.p1  ORF type:complete len:208 (+),score=40.53 TRINITY_DN16741_c0_g1_i1:77-700(+)